jgi:hypothetical protein
VRWARSAVGLGLLLLVAAFCFGVDTPIAVTVAGQSYRCGDVIPAGMLVSGQSGSSRATVDARVAAACGPLEQRARWAVWGGLGLGALVLLAGWTVLSEREHELEQLPQPMSAPA